MSKISWDEHRILFMQRKAENPGLSLKDYCEERDLPYNTARKRINLKKAASEEGDLSGTSKVVRAKRSPASSTKTPRKVPDKTAKLTKTDKERPGNKFRELPGAKAASEKIKSTKNNVLRLVDGGSFADKKREKIPSDGTKSRNKCAEETAQTKKIPPEGHILAQLPDLAAARRMMVGGEQEHLNTVIEQAQLRALSFEQLTTEALQVLQEQADNIGGGEIEGTHPALKMQGIMEGAAYFQNDFLSRLAAIYQGAEKLRQSDRKLRLAERIQAFKELESQAKLEIARQQLDAKLQGAADMQAADARANRAIRDALHMREREELDDLGVAEYLEQRGIPVPPTLLARARKQLEDMEPEIEESDVDDDQVERESQEFNRQQAEYQDWLAQRRADVVQLVDSSGCGDVDQHGERRGGEFTADDEGLEIDYSATAELYGEIEATSLHEEQDREIEIEPPEDE